MTRKKIKSPFLKHFKSIVPHLMHVFYHFFFVAVLLKREQRLNKTDFYANLNPLEDVSNPPYCDVTKLFRTFLKVEKLWTV